MKKLFCNKAHVSFPFTVKRNSKSLNFIMLQLIFFIECVEGSCLIELNFGCFLFDLILISNPSLFSGRNQPMSSSTNPRTSLFGDLNKRKSESSFGQVNSFVALFPSLFFESWETSIFNVSHFSNQKLFSLKKLKPKSSFCLIFKI